MRRILVDDARKRNFAKRGAKTIQVPLDEATNVGQVQAANLVALDDALKKQLTSDKVRSSSCVSLAD